MASFTLYRLFRFISASSANITATLGITAMLTFVWVLYQPNLGPGLSQKMGWQAWDTVVTGDAAGPVNAVNEAPPVHLGGAWWNISEIEKWQDEASLPLDVWSPILPHANGLTEIKLVRCFGPFPDSDMCTPSSTPEEDALKGKWVRVKRDLNIITTFWSVMIWYRRTRRLDVPMITDVKLLHKDDKPSDQLDTWHKVSLSTRDGIRGIPGLYLWYKLGGTMQSISGIERAQLITELDVAYGANRAWYGFEKLVPATFPAEGRKIAVSIAIRRGRPMIPKAQPLHFSEDGKFKILQVADLHFSIGGGDCRMATIGVCTDADNRTISLLEKTLDAEKPSMVVFSGDQLNGEQSSWDARSVIAKFSIVVEQRKIPWAVVFGNHDDQDDGKKEDQLKYYQALPYSLAKAGPSDIHGVGNYVLKVRSSDPSAMHLLTLYFLDSGSYSKGLNFLGFFQGTEYDWIHEDQVNWFLQESAAISPIERPFHPDGGSDIGKVWHRSQIPPTSRKLAKPNALMFFHMPLIESYKTPADQDPDTRKPYDVGTFDLERSGAAKTNGGMFENGLRRAKESAQTDVPEVKAVANGHCHLTDNCRRVKGVWLCFGGGGSYAGYGKIGFDRRFRIFDVSDYGETIRTYKRTEKGEILDDMILAGKGAPSL